jgi:hypothetical protein
MNMRQEDYEKGQATETRTEPKKQSEKILLQMKETLNDHRHVSLS